MKERESSFPFSPYPIYNTHLTSFLVVEPDHDNVLDWQLILGHVYDGRCVWLMIQLVDIMIQTQFIQLRRAEASN